MADLESQYRWLTQAGEAPGRTGLEPRWTSSIKNCVGTAYSDSSRVWWTLSHGVLDEVYFPTIDRPQTRDVQLLVTDGETFFLEEKRDMQTTFEYTDTVSPAGRQINRDPHGRFTITKETISDPHASVVLLHVRLTADPGLIERLKVYVLAAPHLGGGGAHNTGRAVDVAGQKVLLAWCGDDSLALAADCSFRRVSCGFVGASDGWQDLKYNFHMDWEYGSATDGNVALTGEVNLDCARMPTPDAREFTLALGFGRSKHSALAATMSSLATPFDEHLARFRRQWERVTLPEGLTEHTGDEGRLLRISQKVVLMHEDKTYAGAFTASMSIPWGYAKGDDDLGGYHLVWTRDMVQSASAMLAMGRSATSLRALVYLACTQKPDGGFAQNFWVNGTPYWTGIQLDEVAFPIILAWRLWKVNALGNFQLFEFVSRAAGYLVRNAPVTQQERWEESAGYSPSTLAAVIAAQCCAAEIATAHGSPELGKFLYEHADWLQAHLEDWTVTHEGSLHPTIKRYYMRVRPPRAGEPWSRPDIPEGSLRLNNRAPDERSVFPAEDIVDGGFLELVRYGIRRADDPIIRDTIEVIDHVLRVETPRGPAWHRYNHDGYGEQKGGGPFLGWGQGRCWPLLTGERAHYELAAGNDVKSLVEAYERFASPGGMLPEQVWDLPEPIEAESGHVECGEPIGSAMPLVWAHAEYLKLIRSVADDRVFDRVEAAAVRYEHGRVETSIQMWKMRRPIHSIAAGKTLRILSGESFDVVYTLDGWESQHRARAQNFSAAGFATDIATDPNSSGEIIFTLHWTQANRWEGRNFSVKIRPAASDAGKPQA